MTTTTPRATTKSPLAFTRTALEVARAALAPDSSVRSRKDFTQHPHAALLALKLFLKTDYRGLAALKAEYKELDADDALETIAGRPAVGHDIDFLTLDTSVACRTRCLDTPGGPLLLMGQASEYDRTAAEPVFRAVFASLAIDAE